MLQPSKLAKELLDTSEINIENPHLIKMLNESSVSGSPLAIGYRATIFREMGARLSIERNGRQLGI